MKKFHLFSLIIFLVSNAGRLSAQNKTTLPNNGLTHSMSTSEQFEMRNSGNNFRITSPPAAPVRNIAEFEPAEAVIIAYVGGFGIPGTVIKDLSNTGKVIIIAATSDQSTVTSLLSSYGANTANCSFLTATIDSWWTRDYSGWFIADSSNKVQVVDFTYNRPRPNDDSLTKYEATLLGITYYGMNLVTTGGNYMCDGYNDAVSTVLVEQDNTTLDSTQIRLFASEYLGINNYMIRPDPLGQYIEHIDCWGKYLAPDKILIDSVPSGDPQYSVYEACAAYFASTNCPYGYKYKVYRPLIAGSSTSAATEPYSNTFIFNNRVFVPINGGTTSTNDTAALKLYRKAMPGYTVKAYTASGSQAWLNTDALHCRTHEIADRSMLYIEHYPLYGIITSSSGYTINAKVISYAGNAIAANYPEVIYKVNYSGTWDSIPMSLVAYHSYTATIPVQVAGDTIFYYIKAKDVTGKLAYHALMGKADPHFFIVGGAIGIQEVNAHPDISFFTFPNPSQGDFYVFLKSNYSDKASIKIYSITGNIVYKDNFDIESGANKKLIHLNNLSQGIYILEVRTNSNVMTKRLIIQ